MSRTQHVIRGVLVVGALAAFAACDSDNAAVLGPTPADPIFSSYVAIGNSITAGYQSHGINDSTQKQSFALLLAKQMHTRFAYPALLKPGCPPPLANLLTGALVGGATSTDSTCALRDPASATALLNNVAVPGITSGDPTKSVGPNVLYQLLLGGKSMIQKALDNQPTFATVWVGNNDILEPALGGFPAGATPVTTFQTNYAKMMNELTAGAPGIKGVLIGVVQVAMAPLDFQAGLLTNPAVAAAASQVAGRPVTLDPLTCTGANLGALVNFQYLVAIRSRPAVLPGTVYCQKILGGGPSDPGDAGILDIGEQATVAGIINGYNAYIKAKADSIGFAYYDPNIRLAALRSDGSIPPFPNLASPAPFGQYISLDGVHPAAAAHVVLANDLIDVINAKYGTALAKLQ
jgi:lysophospholipase L1-like esterase